MRVHLLFASATLVAILAAPRAAIADDAPSGGMHSPAAFGIGLFLSTVGAAGLATGGYFFASAGDPCSDISTARIPTPNEIDACQTSVIKKAGGVVGMVTGGAFVVAGIPLIAVGATPEDEKPSSQARLRFDVAPTGGSMRLDF